jgi:N-hydroxyarylamine O-acetyltransferase
MNRDTVPAVLEKLGMDRPECDLAGLRTVYAAWCRAVPFDNVLKMIHLAEQRPDPLPGSTPDSFFGAWLECGAGGTCWAGNGALHDLLEQLGFAVQRALATMMPHPEVRGPNHGSVVVTIEGDRWIADASILSGEPLRIPLPDEPAETGPLPRIEWLDGHPAVVWRMLRAPGGFPCRIERIGVEAAEFEELHRQSAVWSPFNYELSGRLMHARVTVGISGLERYELEGNGPIAASTVDRDGRERFLVEELGISEEIARRLPDDRPAPPRPEVPARG